MRTAFVLLILLAFGVLSAQNPIPIATIQGNPTQYDGMTDVIIEGVITVGAGTTITSRLNAFIQDDSGKGLMLYAGTLTSAHTSSLIRGNKLRVTGEIDEFNGITEMKNFTFTVLETGLSIEPYIIPLTIPEAQSYATWEGTLVSVTGTLYEDPYTAGGGTNLNIEDADGERVTCRAWSTTGIDTSNLTEGMEITVVGAASFYGTSAQVLPGYQEDVIFEIETEPVISNIAWTPTNPGTDDPILVSATITDDNDVEEAFLEYRLESATTFTTLFMGANGTQFSGTLPALNTLTQDEDNFVIRIRAIDDDGNETQSPETTIIVSGGGQTWIDMADIIGNLSQYNGEVVTVRGIVTMGAGILRADMLNVYIQDMSGVPEHPGQTPRGCGLELFDYDITAAYEADLVRGNIVEVTGTVEEYQGTVELTDFTYIVIERGVAIGPYAISTTIGYLTDPDVQAALTGTMVKIEATTVDMSSAGGGTNLNVSGSSGELTVRIWDTAGLDLSYIRSGDPLIVMGLLDSYNGAPQVVSGYNEDILDLVRINPDNLSWTPQPAFVSDEIHLVLDMDYPRPITSARVFYRPEEISGWFQADMVKNDSTGVFDVILPPMESLVQNPQQFVYYVEAMDNVNTVISSDNLKIRVYSGSPSVEAVTWTSPAMTANPWLACPFMDEVITLRAQIIDPDDRYVAQAWVYYGLVSRGSTPWSKRMAVQQGNWYSVSLPPFDSLAVYDDDLQFYIEVIDNETKTTRTEMYEVVVAPRAPIIREFSALTDVTADSVAFRAQVIDTDGLITQVQLQYTKDYDSKVHNISMVRDSVGNPNLYYGYIMPQASGVTVRAWVWAVDDSGHVSSEYPANDTLFVEYTYPVKNHRAILKIPPKAFNPYENETIPIDFYSQEGDRAILRIYSRDGKLVHTAQNMIITNVDGLNRYEWDGRNRAHSLLPLGVYICHLEVTEVNTGKTKSATAPIVIGDKLK